MYCKLIKSSLLLSFILASPKVLAATELEFTPYIGGDAQIRKMGFKKGLGDGLFKTESIQGNFYLGIKLNKFFGFEIGHQVTDKKNKNTLISEEAHLGNIRRNVVPGWQEIGTWQIKGWNLNAMGFLPINNEYRISLIGLLGLSRLEIKLKDTWILSDLPTNPQEQIKFKKTKNLLRAGCGLQKMFTNTLGVRTAVIFENTARFNSINQNFSGRIYTIKLKNSWNYGLGVFIIF